MDRPAARFTLGRSAMSSSTFEFAGAVAVEAASERGDLLDLVVLLRAKLQQRRGESLRFVNPREPGGKVVQLELRDSSADWPQRDPRRTDEAYRIHITRSVVTLTGAGVRGCYHAVRSLLNHMDDKGRIACGSWEDWPRFPTRGAHLYIPAPGDLDYFDRLLEYLAGLGMNTVYLELGAAVQSHRHPRINEAWSRVARQVHDYPFGQNQFANRHDYHGRGKDSFHGDNGGWGQCLSHDQVRRILRTARQHHLQIVPEIQSLSHCYWLCLAYPEIAERNDDPYPCTYCPSNERTYELLFDVMDEWLDLFEPRQVHIGHDEWYFRAVCPRCREQSPADLLARDVNRIHDHLAARGVSCVMWADQLINPDSLRTPRIKEWGTGRMIQWAGGERHYADDGGQYTSRACHQALAKISDRIVLADWYYVISPDTAGVLSQQGRRVLLGNFDPEFLDAQPEPLGAAGVDGGFISTWVQASALAHAHNNWPLLAMITADMLWRRQGSTQPLRERMPRYLRDWSQRRGELLQPHVQLIEAKAQPAELPASPAMIRPGDSEPLVIHLPQPCRAIRLLLALESDQCLDRVGPLYDFSQMQEYLRATEVLRCRLVHVMKPGVEVVGHLSLHAGLEVGVICTEPGMTRWTRPALADPVQCSDGRFAFAFEWRHLMPTRQPVSRIELSPGTGLKRGAVMLFAAWSMA
jgi:hypothetical protein